MSSGLAVRVQTALNKENQTQLSQINAENASAQTRDLRFCQTETAMAPSIDDMMSNKVSRWVNHVRQHEARENQVVQDAFNLNIGPED